MKIMQNAVVKMHYSVIDKNNNDIDSSMNEEPLEVIIGSGYLIPGLENALIGKNIGDKVTVEIEPTSAYGDIKEDLFAKVDLNRVPQDAHVGQQLQTVLENGQPLTVTIIELNYDKRAICRD